MCRRAIVLYSMVLHAVLLRTNHLCVVISSKIRRSRWPGLATDFPFPDEFAGRRAMDSVGYGMTRRLMDEVFASVGGERDDIWVRDYFTANEV